VSLEKYSKQYCTVSLTQLYYYLKSTCLVLDIDHHQAKIVQLLQADKKCKIQNVIMFYVGSHSVKILLFHNKIVTLYMIDGS
jgi:hypothetical protein